MHFSLPLALVSLGGYSNTAAHDATQKPNVLWILMDDFGYNDWGLHNKRNSREILTPNMDALATSPYGIHLERFYSQPICTPTRTQLLSGRYQIHTGMQHAVLWKQVHNGLPQNETTIAEHLKPLGYATHAIGKWHIGMTELWRTPLHRGFDTFLGFWGGSEDYWSHYAGGFLDFRNGEELVRGAVHGQRSSTAQSNATYSTHLFSQRAVEIIANRSSTSTAFAAKQKPFFIYLAYQATHAPLQAPQEVISTFMHIKDPNRRIFAAMAAVADEGIGNITAELKQSGSYNNTVIFCTGDNGGQVRAGGNNWPLRGFKGSLWEGGMRQSAWVHSPLLPARGPNTKSEGFVWRGLFHVSDWLPTTLYLAGDSDPPKLRDGYNMWPALVSGKDSPRQELLHEIDRIAFTKYACGGPNPSDSPWDVDQHAVTHKFVRAALHSVVNGTHYKLVIGECAGWDTDSLVHPPPGWTPQSFEPTSRARQCGQQPSCTQQTSTKTVCQPPLLKDQQMDYSCFNTHINNSWGCPPNDPSGDPFLFNLDNDQGEYCDLSVAIPDVTREMMRRLDSYRSSEVPVRFPSPDPKMNPRKCKPPIDYWFATDEKFANGSFVCGR